MTIPEGAAVNFPVHWLHHSPLYWKDPEVFNPDRYPQIIYVLLIDHLNIERFLTDLQMRRGPSDLNYVTCPLALVLVIALG